MPVGVGGGLRSVARAGLGQDTGHMVSDGPEADGQFARNLLIAAALGHQRQYLHLPWRQAVLLPGRGISRALAALRLRREPFRRGKFSGGIKVFVGLGIPSLSTEQQAEIVVRLRVVTAIPRYSAYRRL